MRHESAYAHILTFESVQFLYLFTLVRSALNSVRGYTYVFDVNVDCCRSMDVCVHFVINSMHVVAPYRT